MLSLRKAASLLRTSHHQTAFLLTRATAPPPRPLPTPPTLPRPSNTLLTRPNHTLHPRPPQSPTPSPTSQASKTATIGLFSGTLGALCGVGGAIFAIPALVRFGNLTQRIAAGNSLVAVTAIASTSALSLAGAGHIDWQVAATLGGSAAVITPFGAAASARANPALLRKALGGFMLVLAPIMPLRGLLERRGGTEEGGSGGGNPRLGVMTGVGGVVGFVSGLLGISGGSLFTPLVAVLCPDASFRAVIGTSFAAMVVPTAIGAVSYARMGCVTPKLVPPLVAGAVAGACVGSAAVLAVPEEALRWAFAVVFSVLGTRILRAPIKAPVGAVAGARNVGQKVATA